MSTYLKIWNIVLVWWTVFYILGDTFILLKSTYDMTHTTKIEVDCGNYRSFWSVEI